jgi:hypothetical protein
VPQLPGGPVAPGVRLPIPRHARRVVGSARHQRELRKLVLSVVTQSQQRKRACKPIVGENKMVAANCMRGGGHVSGAIGGGEEEGVEANLMRGGEVEGV